MLVKRIIAQSTWHFFTSMMVNPTILKELSQTFFKITYSNLFWLLKNQSWFAENLLYQKSDQLSKKVSWEAPFWGAPRNGCSTAISSEVPQNYDLLFTSRTLRSSTHLVSHFVMDKTCLCTKRQRFYGKHFSKDPYFGYHLWSVLVGINLMKLWDSQWKPLSD